jgi:hypothetical protein
LEEIARAGSSYGKTLTLGCNGVGAHDYDCGVSHLMHKISRTSLFYFRLFFCFYWMSPACLFAEAKPLRVYVAVVEEHVMDIIYRLVRNTFLSSPSLLISLSSSSIAPVRAIIAVVYIRVH